MQYLEEHYYEYFKKMKKKKFLSRVERVVQLCYREHFVFSLKFIILSV